MYCYYYTMLIDYFLRSSNGNYHRCVLMPHACWDWTPFENSMRLELEGTGRQLISMRLPFPLLVMNSLYSVRTTQVGSSIDFLGFHPMINELYSEMQLYDQSLIEPKAGIRL